MFLIETSHKDSHTELILFYRDKNDKKHVKNVKDFRPYFYVNEEENVPDDYRINGVEIGHKDLFGKKLKKIFVKRSKDILGVRELFQVHYEADINFAQRYIIDVIGEADIYKLHTLSLDIETDTRDTFPNVASPDTAIISCSFADNKGLRRKYIYKSPESKVDIIMDDVTKVFKTEELLLEGILSLIIRVDPDIITGWNVINFDLAYLINRMKQLKINYSKLSPLGIVFCELDKRKKQEKWNIRIMGRIILDGLEAYDRFRKITGQGRAEKYSLEFTAQSVLGIGKINLQKEKFHDMWINNPNKLLEYNLRDTELVIQILEKLEIVEFYNYIRSKSMAQMSQIYQTTSLVDGFLLRAVHNKYVLPSKDKKNSKKYSGAYVFPPIPGLYNNILALDLKSLYPNIIKTFNVGYETFNPDGEIKLDENIGFDRGIGIMSKIMRELEKERKIYKKLMWKADIDGHEEERKLNHYKQSAVKVLMNCFSHDTDILTPSGTKNIKDLKIGDIVYSIHPESQKLEEKKVTKTYEYNYDGDMIHFNTQTTDLMVTPNHNMLVTDWNNDNFFVEAKDYNDNYVIPLHKPTIKPLPYMINLLHNVNYSDYRTYLFKNVDLRYIKQELSQFVDNITFKRINKNKCEIFCDKNTLAQLWNNGYDVRVKHKRNKNCNYNVPFILNENFSKLLGWFLSEGFLYKSIPKGRRGMSKSIVICQHENVNKKNVDEIKKMFNDLHLKYRYDDKTISFSSDIWYDNLILCGSDSRNKHVPDEWLSGLDKEYFFRTLYLGDGHKNKNIYTTNSFKLKEQVLIVLTELGYKAWYSKDNDGCFRIKFHKKNYKPHKENILTVKNNSDKVYCVEVEDNHTVLAGRNGKFTWTGQSFYGYLGYPGSRLYKKEIAEAITRWGVNIIKWTYSTLKNAGYDVIYGDTDSCVYDTNIEYYDENNNKYVKKIGEMFEEHLLDGKVDKREKNNIIVKPNKYINTLSINTDNGKIENKKITYIMGHKIKKKLYKIKVGEKEVIITQDHSLMVKRDDKIIKVKPQELKKTDKLLLKSEKFK